MKKVEILRELSELLATYASRSAMWGDYIDDFDERKRFGEEAKRKKDALQIAMLMVDMHYEGK